MSQPPSLTDLLSARGSILLDFDGPLCSIFANHAAPVIAETLRTTLRESGVQPGPVIEGERDPLEVLRWTATLAVPSIVKQVESKLCAEEFIAAQTAAPTRYGREVIVAAYEAGKTMAVVSNNSAGAISAYLRRQRLDRYALPICGREFARPELMKPNPEPILRAVKALNTVPGDCVLIGDSLADIYGAQAAQVSVIGYANREEKIDTFSEAGADIVLTSMADIACPLIDMKL